MDIITGNYTHAAQLMIIWGIIALFRRLGEPKILGDQTGLSPILSLVGIYVGMLLGGVLGMIVGPLLLLVFINLTKLGIFSPVMADLSAAASDVAAILKSITNFVLNGHSVTVPRLGTFTGTITSRSAASREAFTASNIKGMRVRFRKSSELDQASRYSVRFVRSTFDGADAGDDEEGGL